MYLTIRAIGNWTGISLSGNHRLSEEEWFRAIEFALELAHAGIPCECELRCSGTEELNWYRDSKAARKERENMRKIVRLCRISQTRLPWSWVQLGSYTRESYTGVI